MRHPSFLFVPLLAPLLLTGCVNDTASYQIEGNDHALTVRVVQDYFWSKQGTVKQARWNSHDIIPSDRTLVSRQPF